MITVSFENVEDMSRSEITKSRTIFNLIQTM